MKSATFALLALLLSACNTTDDPGGMDMGEDDGMVTEPPVDREAACDEMVVCGLEYCADEVVERFECARVGSCAASEEGTALALAAAQCFMDNGCNPTTCDLVAEIEDSTNGNGSTCEDGDGELDVAERAFDEIAAIAVNGQGEQRCAEL